MAEAKLNVVIIFCRHKYAPPVKMVPGDHITFNLNNLHNAVNEKLLNGNMYNCVATSEHMDATVCDAAIYKIKPGQHYDDTSNSMLSRKLPELPKTPDSTGTRVMF